jgi:putative transposase
MKYRFMREQQGAHSVAKMARVLGVSRSGYYAWKRRPPSRRKRERAVLREEISAIQREKKYRYGSPRVTAELRRRGKRVGRNRVARIMRESGLGARRRKRYRSTTNSRHSLPIAQNLLQRKFRVAGKNEVWVSDISYLATAEGWLYLCVVIDLYSRKVVGWSMDRRMKASLVVRAFMMACMVRNPQKGLIFHSDRGSQYCSGVFRRRLERNGVRQSMSGKGDCWDNAPAESFFKTLKNELCGHQAFRSREEARTAVFEYIEVFYNRDRLHSTLGYLTPAEYECLIQQEAA